jgi:hypothetical protein
MNSGKMSDNHVIFNGEQSVCEGRHACRPSIGDGKNLLVRVTIIGSGVAHG